MKKIFQAALIALGLFASAKSEAQTISPQFFGLNAWMPYAIGTNVLNGKLDQSWSSIQDSKATIMRYGGITVDHNMTTNAQYIKIIDSSRANGMEPIIQVPFNNYQFTAAQAASIVQYINVTMGKNVKYWMIGNEPNLGYSFTTASQIANYHKPFASAMKNIDPSIIIIGPEIAWFDQAIIDGLTTPGGANDITGKDAAGRYYVDVISFHTYPFNGTQTRSQMISKLTSPGALQDDLTYLNTRVSSCNSYHNRTGTAALKTAITEANVNWKNSSTDNLNGVGANSFIGGQFVAEMMGIGMKKGLDFFNLWSVIEGNSTELNIGYLDRTTRNKKPLFYHYKLLAENFKGNYANGTTNQLTVKSFGSKDGTQVSVIILNEDLTNNYNYTVRLNTSAIAGTNPLKINIDAGIANEYTDAISNQSSVLLTFDLSGTLMQKCVYSLAGNAMANLPPTCTSPSAVAACNVPVGLNSTLITASTATLNWATTGAASYNVRYKTSASAYWTTMTSTTLSKAISGLTAATVYEFQVASVCSATSSSAYSASATFTTAASACNVPAGLNSTLITASTATLNWATTGAASYNVRYKPAASTAWITSNIAALTKPITGLTAATAYEFQVASVCSATSSSAYSASATFTTAASACNVPAGLNATLITASTATLNWATTGAASYNVRYKTSASAYWTTMTSTTLSKAISGLTAATVYEFQVASVCSATSSSAYSASATFTTLASACNVPAGLNATLITASAATLNWAATGAASYNVRYKPAASTTWTTSNVAALTKPITGLTASTTYEFQVASVCSATSLSAYSASATFTTLMPTLTFVTIDTGSIPSSVPYGTASLKEHSQFIVTKSELTAAGYNSANNMINSLAFFVSSSSAKIMNGFTIKIVHTSVNAFPSNSFLSTSGAAVVYNSNYTPTSASWNKHVFSTPFIYNGSDNLLIDIIWSNSSFSGNSIVNSTAKSTYKTLSFSSNKRNSNDRSGTLSFNRPNIQLEFAPALPSKGGNIVGAEDPENSVLDLDMNLYPNPASSVVNISFNILEGEKVKVSIYNILGQLAVETEYTAEEKGKQLISLDFTSDANLVSLTAGTYICSMDANGERTSRKFILVR